MPKIELECSYCGRIQEEHLYDVNFDNIPCNVCNSKMGQQNVKSRPNKYDAYGYAAGEEYRRKWKKN